MSTLSYKCGDISCARKDLSHLALSSQILSRTLSRPILTMQSTLAVLGLTALANAHSIMQVQHSHWSFLLLKMLTLHLDHLHRRSRHG